jgi:hypothetical protein
MTNPLSRLQFRLKSLFLLTAVVAVGCLAVPPLWGYVGVIDGIVVGSCIVYVGLAIAEERRMSRRRKHFPLITAVTLLAAIAMIVSLLLIPTVQ